MGEVATTSAERGLVVQEGELADDLAWWRRGHRTSTAPDVGAALQNHEEIAIPVSQMAQILALFDFSRRGDSGPTDPVPPPARSLNSGTRLRDSRRSSSADLSVVSFKSVPTRCQERQDRQSGMVKMSPGWAILRPAARMRSRYSSTASL